VALERLAEDTHGDLVSTFTTPWSDGTTGITLSPVELLEKLAALVPLPRVHLVRYGGCLAPHSSLRGAITPTPRQQGVEGGDATTESPRWSWARLLKRVFALELAPCPFCRQGALRMIAAITQAEVLRKMLRHLKLAADPPPLAPARARQATFDWVASAHAIVRGLRSDVRAAEGCLTPLSVCNPVCNRAPSSLPTSPFPRPSPQGTPEARPSPILRRLSSTSQRRAAPRSAVLWAAPAGCRGALGALGGLAAHKGF
jgi:hypothetical protein